MKTFFKHICFTYLVCLVCKITSSSFLCGLWMADYTNLKLPVFIITKLCLNASVLFLYIFKNRNLLGDFWMHESKLSFSSLNLLMATNSINFMFKKYVVMASMAVFLFTSVAWDILFKDILWQMQHFLTHLYIVRQSKNKAHSPHL